MKSQMGQHVGIKYAKATAILALIGLAACSGDSESSKKRLLETGNKYFAAGKYREASIIYRKLIKNDPRYGEAYYRWGLAELREGRPIDAIRALRRASELQPENDDAHAKLGDLYLTAYLSNTQANKTLLVDLAELYERVLKRNPRSYDGLRLKGYVLAAERKWPEAIKTFEAANQVKPDQPDLWLVWVQALYKNDQADEAERLTRQAIEKHKNYAALYDFLYSIRMAAKDAPGAEKVLEARLQNNSKSWDSIQALARHYLVTQNKPKMLEALKMATNNTKDFPNGHQLVGDFYLRLGDLESARTELEAAMVANPKDKLHLQKQIVEILSNQGKYAESVALADKLVQENKDDAEAKAIRASLRLHGGKPEELNAAISEFQSVLSKMNNNPVLRFNLGEAYLGKGDLENARLQFQEALKLKSNYIPPKLALARIYLARRQFGNAQQLADEVLKPPYQGLVPPRLIRIEALMGLSDFRTARNELEILLNRAPNLRDAQNLMGLLDLAENKYPDAEKHFRQLYEGTPPDARGLFGLAQTYVSTNRTDEARRILNADLEKKPPYARNIRLALAEISMRSNQYDQAIDTFKTLIQEVPKAPDLWTRLGETYRRANKLDDSLKALEQARQLAPNDVAAWTQTAITLEAAGRKDQLKPVYEQIIKLSPDNAIALNNLAFFLAEGGSDLDQALTYAQRAKQQMPNNPDVADTLGWVYIKKNLSDDAIKIFRDLVNQKPNHVTWRYHLALALFQKGDKLNARKELEVALKNNPKPEENQKIKELLSRIG